MKKELSKKTRMRYKGTMIFDDLLPQGIEDDDAFSAQVKYLIDEVFAEPFVFNKEKRKRFPRLKIEQELETPVSLDNPRTFKVYYDDGSKDGLVIVKAEVVPEGGSKVKADLYCLSSE